jgi:hypothetical protein
VKKPDLIADAVRGGMDRVVAESIITPGSPQGEIAAGLAVDLLFNNAL